MDFEYPASTSLPTLADVRAAHQTIASTAIRTPLVSATFGLR